ncbi:MAG: hypothetical protein J7539_09455 [Niabella sp.]|nr:hypothetical protein [Niabella sp.]
MLTNTLHKSVGLIETKYELSVFKGIQVDGEQFEESENSLAFSLKNLYVSNTGQAQVRLEKVGPKLKEPLLLPKSMKQFWDVFSKEHSALLVQTSKSGSIESVQKENIDQLTRNNAVKEIFTDLSVSSDDKMILNQRAQKILSDTTELKRELNQSLIYNSLFPSLFNIKMIEGEEVELGDSLACYSLFADDLFHQMNQYAKFMGSVKLQNEDLYSYTILGDLDSGNYCADQVEQAFLKSPYAGNFNAVFDYEFDYTGSFYFDKETSVLKNAEIVLYEQVNDILKGIFSIKIKELQ